MHMEPDELLEFANQEMVQAIENRKTGEYFQNNHKIQIPVLVSKIDETALLVGLCLASSQINNFTFLPRRNQ